MAGRRLSLVCIEVRLTGGSLTLVNLGGLCSSLYLRKRKRTSLLTEEDADEDDFDKDFQSIQFDPLHLPEDDAGMTWYWNCFFCVGES